MKSRPRLRPHPRSPALHPDYWRPQHLDALAVTIDDATPQADISPRAAAAPPPPVASCEDAPYVPTLSGRNEYDALLQAVWDSSLKWCMDDYLQGKNELPISAQAYTVLEALCEFRFPSTTSPDQCDALEYLIRIIILVFMSIYPSELSEDLCMFADVRTPYGTRNVVKLMFHSETMNLRFAGSLEFACCNDRISRPILAILETRGNPIPKVVAYLLAFAQSYFRDRPDATVAQPYIITSHQRRAVVAGDERTASTRWTYTVYTADVHRDYLESLDKLDFPPSPKTRSTVRGSLNVRASREFELSSGEQRVELAKFLTDLVPKLIARDANELGGIKAPRRILENLRLERCAAYRRQREQALARARREAKSRALKRKSRKSDPGPVESVISTAKRRKLDASIQKTPVAV